MGRALLPQGAGDRVVVVRDDEPTSLVAYALSSRCGPAHICTAAGDLLISALLLETCFRV